MKEYEIQEWEAEIRSILAGFGAKEEVIDSLIKDDIYLGAMQKHIIINKEDNMEGPAEARGTAAVPPKKFESIVNRLRSKVDMARQLRNRSASLVSTLIGSPPILSKDDKEKVEMPTTMLASVLERIEQDLEENLEQISENLDKLENAW